MDERRLDGADLARCDGFWDLGDGLARGDDLGDGLARGDDLGDGLACCVDGFGFVCDSGCGLARGGGGFVFFRESGGGAGLSGTCRGGGFCFERDAAGGGPWPVGLSDGIVGMYPWPGPSTRAISELINATAALYVVNSRVESGGNHSNPIAISVIYTLNRSSSMFLRCLSINCILVPARFSTPISNLDIIKPSPLNEEHILSNINAFASVIAT